jgi:PAS domain S-box-containing protein
MSLHGDEVRLLLVEDNPGDAHLMQDLLEEASPGRFLIGHAQTLSEARTALRHSAPDLVLLDLDLPDSGGLDTARAVISAATGIPVVVLTGITDERTRQEGMQLGLQDVLSKEIPNGGVLVRNIEHAIERAALHRELVQLNQTLRAIRSVNQIITAVDDSQELIESVCTTLVNNRGWAGAWIALVGSNGDLTGHADTKMRDMSVVYSEIDSGRYPHCMREAFSKGGVVSFDHEEPGCRDCPCFTCRTGPGALGAPLEHAGRTFGFLHLSVPRKGGTTDEERALIDEVAHDIALALDKIEGDEQRARAEQTVAYQARLLDRVSDAVISTDAEFRIRTWNGAAEHIYGWTAQEAIGRRVGELTRVEYDEVTPEEVLEQFRTAGNWSGEVRHFRRDGTPIHMFSSVTVLRDGDGEIVGAVAVNRDVTERRQVLEAMRDSEETYRTLVETLPDGVALIDLDGTIQRVNQGLVDMTGRGQHESLVGESFLQLVAPAHRNRAETNFLLTIESGYLKEVEYDLVRADNHQFPAELSVSLLRTGEEQALVCVVRDISERKRVQSQLAQSDRMASVGMLAAGVAHEINNPLAYILGNLEAAAQDISLMAASLRSLRDRALRGLGASEARELLGDALATPDDTAIDDMVEETGEALRGAWRVRDIVRDLRVFSRVEDKKTQPLAVNSVVESAISLAYNEIKYRAQLVKSLEPVPLVLGNEGRMSQVFLNLLINAAQAIDEGAADENSICVRTRLETNEVVVEVEDSGKGIPPSDLGQVFEAFFTTKPAGIGSGLGLAICRSIVQEHGGTIAVASELGVGTTLSVRLPVASRIEYAIEPEESEDLDLPAGGRLLVVDDDPLVGALLSRTLGRRCDVVVMGSGAAARDLLASDRGFDVVLCDVMMPDTSGIDLVEWLMTADPDLSRRVVFMTGGVFTEKAKAFLESSELPVLEKPFDGSQLRKELASLLGNGSS